MKDIIIRPIKPTEYSCLNEFLYEAIFQPIDSVKLSKDIVNKPELQIFIENFGKPDDHCFVAEVNNNIVGAVWTRILSGEIKGYGNIDAKTPEFAISLYQEYRNQGIGTKLMRAMLILLKEKGYQQTSLAVQKENYAVSMYRKVGFRIIKELEEEYLMICEL